MGTEEDRDDRQRGGGSGQQRDVEPLALAAAMGLALAAQHVVTGAEAERAGVVLYLLAAGLFVWGLRSRCAGDPRFPGAEGPREPQVGRSGNGGRLLVRAGLGLLTLGLAWTAYRGFSGNHFSASGTAAWLGALGAFLLGAAQGPAVVELIPQLGRRLRRVGAALGQPWLRRRRPTVLPLALVVLVGVFFRVYRLSGVPLDMTSDHAENLLDVHDVLRGARPIFFPRNTGREALQFYLTAALIRLTPLTISHLALKVGTALVSIATIPVTFLLGRTAYNRRVGLLAAGFTALSRWDVAISRVGLRFAFAPLFAALTLLFLFRAFRHNRRNDWLLCGLALGVGLYSYTAVRILPLLLVVLTGAKAAWDVMDRLRGARGRAAADPRAYSEASALSVGFWINAVLGAGASLLVFLPLLRYMVGTPEMFWFRVTTRVVEVERALPTSLWRVFIGNLRDALLMFNYRGCTVWVNTVPGDPMLGHVSGALFVLGAVVVLWRLFKQGDRRGLYLLLSLVILLLPSALSLTFPEENPSAVRAAGAIPVAALLVALAADVVTGSLRHALGRGRRWLAVLLPAALLLATGCLTYNWYFVTYDRQYRRMAWNTTEMGQVVRRFADHVGDLDHAYHIPYHRWADTRNIAINAGDITWRNTVEDPDEVCEQRRDGKPRLYLVHPLDGESLNALRDCFPEGRVIRYRSAVPGGDFFIYLVSG